MNELAYASATEIARLVRAREVFPVEIVDYFLDRIGDRNRSLNAFVFIDADGARERARAAEKALYSGEALGPLHGVPAALKDLFDYRPGWVNTLGGIRALAQRRATNTASLPNEWKQPAPSCWAGLMLRRLASAVPATISYLVRRKRLST